MHRLHLILLPFLIWQWSFSQASTQAEPSTELPTLLIFSGSDWCLPCIRLEREVFSQQAFLDFTRDKVRVVKADFPQKVKLSEQLVKRNEELADRYNPRGSFPLVVLLNPDGSVKAPISHEDLTLELMLKDLKGFLQSDFREFRSQTLLMGSSFEFIVVSNDQEAAERTLNDGIAEVKRLEYLLSEWKEGTEVDRLNKGAGFNTIAVSSEVYGLTQRSLALSSLTQGAFDISFGGIDLYEFDQRVHTDFPDTNLIQEKLKHVGFEKINLKADQSIFLSDSGMSIGFGALGKGYAADEVKKMWEERGVRSGVVNASGDLIAWGSKPDGSPWRVGIADPDNHNEVLYWLVVEDKAVATSGSYEKYFEYEGERYAHILDPKTGFPVKDKKSVTVISPSAELSDALATALFVLDLETGLDLVRQLPQAECLIIDVNDELHLSSKIELIDAKNP